MSVGASPLAPAGTTSPGPAGGQELPPDLADQLYTKIERRLRMELLLDEERRSPLNRSLWSAGG